MRPQRLHTIRDLEQVRAISDQTRMRILQELVPEPRTAMQLAKLLGEKTTKIYHHVETLEKAGLIELVETRQKRGFVEKFYRSIADDFVFDRGLLMLTEPKAEAHRGNRLFVEGLAASLSEAERHLGRNADGHAVIPPRLYRLNLRGSPDRLKSLLAELDRWAENASGNDEGDHELAVTLAIHEVVGSHQRVSALRGGLAKAE